MKITTSIFAIAIILLIISCGQAIEKKTAIPHLRDTTETLVDKQEKERLEKRKLIEEQEKLDSINDDRILSEALKIAEQHKAHSRFKKNYVASMPDSSYQVDVDLNCDYYFTNEFPHLIIKRKTPGSIYIDIYAKREKQFHKVLSHKEWALEYVGDTIRDINGDKLKDFVVNWYGCNRHYLTGQFI